VTELSNACPAQNKREIRVSGDPGVNPLKHNSAMVNVQG